MTYYVAVIRDSSDAKKDLFAVYAYDATSEVAFRNNMAYHYGHVSNSNNTVIYTNADKFFAEYDGILENYVGMYTRNRILACMRGDSTDHFAVNFSIYKDK